MKKVSLKNRLLKLFLTRDAMDTEEMLETLDEMENELNNKEEQTIDEEMDVRVVLKELLDKVKMLEEQISILMNHEQSEMEESQEKTNDESEEEMLVEDESEESEEDDVVLLETTDEDEEDEETTKDSFDIVLKKSKVILPSLKIKKDLSSTTDSNVILKYKKQVLKLAATKDSTIEYTNDVSDKEIHKLFEKVYQFNKSKNNNNISKAFLKDSREKYNLSGVNDLKVLNQKYQDFWKK